MRSVVMLLALAVPASAAWVLAPALVAQSVQQERAGGGAVRGHALLALSLIHI